MFSYLLKFLFVTACVCAKGKHITDTKVVFLQNENLNDSGLNGCELALTRIRHSTDRHVFVGCHLTQLTDMNTAVNSILNFTDCNDVFGVLNTTLFVLNYTLETNVKKLVRGCMAPMADVVLFISTIIRNHDKSLTVYFEQKRIPKKSIPLEYHEATFKVLPCIDVKLPADFFYPFSCCGSQIDIGSTLLLALSIPLAKLFP